MNELKMPFGLVLQVRIDFIIQVYDESTETHIQLARIKTQFTFLSLFPKWNRNVRHSMIVRFGLQAKRKGCCDSFSISFLIV